MLGMSYTSCSLKLLPGIECPLCRNKLYCTFLKKSTPFSKFFTKGTPDFFRARLPAGPVKGVFSPKMPFGESVREIAQSVVFCNRCYVNTESFLFSFPQGCGLWKTFVDNCVDNVENTEFSTVIRPPAFPRHRWKTLSKSGLSPAPGGVREWLRHRSAPA